MADTRQRHDTTLWSFITLTALAYSGWTTGLGLSGGLDPALSWMYVRVVPVAGAIISVLVLWSLWRYLYDAYPQSDLKTRKKLSFGIVALCLITVSLSTTLSVVGMAGNTAVQRHIESLAHSGENVLRLLREHYAEDRQLLSTIRGYKRQFRELAIEESSGGLTGKAGIGDVTRQLNRIANQFENLELAINESENTAQEQFHQANQLLTHMRKVIYQREPLVQREREFSTLFNDLMARFQSLKNGRAVDAVGALARDLDTIGSVSISLGSGELRRRQDLARERIAKLINESKETIRQAVQSLSVSDTRLPRLELIDRTQAVFVHGLYVLPFWALCLAVDLFPILVIFFLTISADRSGLSGGGAVNVIRQPNWKT